MEHETAEEQPHVQPGTRKLSPEGSKARDAIRLALLPMVPDRIAAVFLGPGRDKTVQNTTPEVVAGLMLECLPRFIRQRGGEVILESQISPHGLCGRPTYKAVRVAGESRRFPLDGTILVRFPEERVAITIESKGGFETTTMYLGVQSNKDSDQFFAEWKHFTRQNHYLQTQAFFPDGEILPRKRVYDWDDILLPEATIKLIRTHAEQFIRNRDRLKALGVKGRRGLILAGPPGTGKTLLGKVLADSIDCPFIWVLPRHVTGASCFKEVLTTARFVAPCVLFLEDLDLFGCEREISNWSVLGELMNQLDGAVDSDGIVTIATTNRPEVIERALRNRPGRFDRIVRMGPMDEDCRRQLLGRLLRKVDVAPETLVHLVASTRDFTGAQVEELANTICIQAAGDEDAQPDRLTVDRASVDAALADLGVERKRGIGFHEQ